MNMTTQILSIAVGASFGFAALVALYRVIVGPTILDRMIASDVFVTTLMLIVGAEMIFNKHTNTIVLMVIFASTSVFATIMVAKYVRRAESSLQDTAPTDIDSMPAHTSLLDVPPSGEGRDD